MVGVTGYSASISGSFSTVSVGAYILGRLIIKPLMIMIINVSLYEPKTGISHKNQKIVLPKLRSVMFIGVIHATSSRHAWDGVSSVCEAFN